MVKNFKGYGYIGSSILGYRLTPIRDFGVRNNSEIRVINTGIRVQNNYNYDKKLRKVTYRKFLKSANKE